MEVNFQSCCRHRFSPTACNLGFNPRHVRSTNIQRCRVRRLYAQAALSTLWTPKAERDSVLVADIGGTNCRFVLCEITNSASASEQILSKTFPTRDYLTFQEALDQFSSEAVFQENVPRAAAFAVAGPVDDNRCAMTNLSWVIDGHELTQRHGIKFAILNDFAANGYGVPTLTTDDLLPLNDVPPADKGPKVVMGPGTGLGQANILWDAAENKYRVWSSEGAHANFAPFGAKQRALQAFVEERTGYCELEAVACGPGLEMIYSFLASETGSPHLKDAPSITQAAIDGSDPLACGTVDLFLQILGAEAGANGLRVLAKGGVYLCGGILPRLGDIVSNGKLLDAFICKEGRFSKVLSQYPLYLVKNTSLGIRGCIAFASQLSAPVDV